MTHIACSLKLAARLAAITATVLLAASCSQNTPDKLMASAQDYLAKGDRSAAVIQLKNLLVQAPDHGEARMLLGQALLESEEYASAEKELSRALELKQPQEKVLPAYAETLLAQGKNQAVVNEVEKYRLFNPVAVAATQSARGDAYARLGDKSRARDAYAAALAAVPAYSRARLGEATLTALDGQVDEALKVTEEIIAVEPALASARALRADLLLAKGNRIDAKKSLEEAITADPRLVPVRMSLISLLIDEGDVDAAARHLDDTRKIAPRDLRVSYFDAAVAVRRGEFEKARGHLQQLLKFLPDHVPSLVLAGSVEMQLRQFALAEGHLRRALARSPNHVGARRMLAVTQLRTGQPARAKETLQPLLDKGMPSDPRLLLLAGETLLANGQIKDSSAYFQAAAAAGNAPGTAAKTRLGQLSIAKGNVEEGFRELEAAAELDGEQYQAELALIAGHLRRNEFEKAMEATKSLERKQPKNPLTFQMYGVVNLAKRDIGAARRGFERALELQAGYTPAAYNLAMLDLAEKRPDDARKRYEALIARDQKNDQLYIALAELQVRMGADSKVIIATLQRGANANPQSTGAWTSLINYLVSVGDAKAAATAAQSAVAALPGDARVLTAAAAAQEAAGEINQAIETYRRIAAMQPLATQPLYRLASVHARQKEFDKAIETLRRVQKLAPGEREVVPQLVQAQMGMNRPDEALREARELQFRDPKFAGGFSLEGDIHAAIGRHLDAAAAYRRALEREPKANAVAIRLHAALASGSRTGEADSLAKKWIADNPKDAVMRLYLGERELAQRNLKASAAHYEAVLALDAGNTIALNNLAWIRGELGDPRALSYAERAIQLAPNNVMVIDTYASLLAKKGDLAKALGMVERARAIDPKRNDLRLNYAKILLKAGRKDDARRELDALAKVREPFRGKEEIEGLLKSL